MEIENKNEQTRDINKKRRGVLVEIRILTAIMVLVLVVSHYFNWLEQDTAETVIILLAFLILAYSFRPYLHDHQQIRLVALILLAAVLVVGFLIFFRLDKIMKLNCFFSVWVLN